MQPPDTLHNAAIWIAVGLLFYVGWSSGQWLIGKLGPIGAGVLAVLVLILVIALALGRV